MFLCRLQVPVTGSNRENGRNVGYIGAREMALHSSEKDRSDAIAAVRYARFTAQLLLHICAVSFAVTIYPEPVT